MSGSARVCGRFSLFEKSQMQAMPVTDANNRSIIKMAELHSSADWGEILNRAPPVKVDSDEES